MLTYLFNAAFSLAVKYQKLLCEQNQAKVYNKIYRKITSQKIKTKDNSQRKTKRLILRTQRDKNCGTTRRYYVTCPFFTLHHRYTSDL